MTYEKKLEFRLECYKKGYNILMDYYDFIPDEEKPKVHKELKSIGL